jgi:mono/diheme cytochrome c family protein
MAWVGAGALAVVTSGSSTLAPSPGTPGNTAVERGRYLTHDVAMCVQCHSPRDESGQIIRSQEFRGAPIPVGAPPFPRIPWASRAPNIRGVDAYPEAALVQLLREGLTKNGTSPERPMPPFRMSREDAEAIVAYLRSLD